MKHRVITEMKKFLFSFTSSRFGNAMNKNLNRERFRGDLECSYLGGILSTCEDIFEKSRNGGMDSRDDIIAELHLLYNDAFNEFQSKYGYKVVDRSSVEKAIKLSEGG